MHVLSGEPSKAKPPSSADRGFSVGVSRFYLGGITRGFGFYLRNLYSQSAGFCRPLPYHLATSPRRKGYSTRRSTGKREQGPGCPSVFCRRQGAMRQEATIPGVSLGGAAIDDRPGWWWGR